MFKVYCLALFASILSWMVFPNQISAQVVSCSVYVDPTSINTNTSAQLNFNLTNTSEADDIIWVKITRPSGNYSITGYSGSGWEISNTESSIIFRDGFLGPGDGDHFEPVILTGDSEASSENWIVEASTDPEGNDPYPCSGSTGTSISGIGLDVTEPSIESITISNISDTSATISWTTNETTTSYVDYGTSEEYGSTASSTSNSISHSVALSGLTANSTYHYSITATDSASNTTNNGDSTFVTAQAGTTTTTTITVQITPTPAVDQTKPRLVITSPTDFSKSYPKSESIKGEAFDGNNISKLEYSLDSGKSYITIPNVTGLNTNTATFSFKPTTRDGNFQITIKATDGPGNTETTKLNFKVDSSPPEIAISTDLKTPLPPSPKIIGTASDPSGISMVEYSTDGGKNWTPADVAVSSKTKIEFSAATDLQLDGNYNFVVRATDTTNNVSCSSPESCQLQAKTIIIDRLPPRIGQILYHVGPLVLNPQIGLPSDTEISLTTSIVGGATSATLNGLSLKNIPGTNLWTTRFNSSSLNQENRISALDGAGNTDSKLTPNVTINPIGSIVSQHPSKLTVYQFDENTESFYPWPGKAYNQANPILITSNGTYQLILPPGTYYLKVDSSTYQPAVSEIFTLQQTSPISQTIRLTKNWLIPLPWLHTTFSIPQSTNTLPLNTQSTNLPITSLVTTDQKTINLQGQSNILSFISIWHPDTANQLKLFEQSLANTKSPLIIVPHVSETELKIFKKRGGYKLDFIADPDGNILNSFSIQNSPTHIIVNRRSEIIHQLIGTKTIDELIDLIE